MSDPIGFRVDYRTPFESGAVRAALKALRLAVGENWERYRDRLSDPEPPSPVDVEGWTGLAVPDRMEKLTVEGSVTLYTNYLWFHYSPIASRPGCVEIFRFSDGDLSVGFRIHGSTPHEWSGYREELRPESERPEPPPDAPRPWDDDYEAWMDVWNIPYNLDAWSINRGCILNLLDRLKQALPVDSISLDERLHVGEAVDGAGGQDHQ